ncbi:MAG: GNAT family N-acetyltransferase [Brevefilum sp.]|nr:GNAT family N-acetyltransferase [Brevefilum sp.]
MNKSFRIENILENDQNTVVEIISRLWGDATIVVHGEFFYVADLPGLKAILEDQIVGILHYRIEGKECEILTLASLVEGQGIGSTLLETLESIALTANCEKLSLTTTNDNLHALGFYQRRGFHLVKLYPGQVSEARKIKPGIPLVGDFNIPIRDELKLEKPIKHTINGKKIETSA